MSPFQINMKGLDGIQGPIYVGTGCVFRRQALYGHDAPKTKRSPTRACNCWPKRCCCTRSEKKKRIDRPNSEIKKKNLKKGDTAPDCALEVTEGGIEGNPASSAIQSSSSQNHTLAEKKISIIHL